MESRSVVSPTRLLSALDVSVFIQLNLTEFKRKNKVNVASSPLLLKLLHNLFILESNW